LVLTDLDLPGVSGVVIMETLRLFRPELPVLCMGEAAVGAVATGPRGCLAKPLQMEELRTQAHAALGSTAPWEPGADSASEQAVRRARARYGEAKSLVDAALELARGSREE
jgi:DNA-binding response OmpR family regulator